MKISGSSNPIYSRFKLPMRKVECINAPYNANPTSVAEPMAKPLPIAAVVFPAESKTSVRYLTNEFNSAI